MHAMTKWSFCLSLLLCILNIRTCSSNGSDTLSAGQSLSVNQSLISDGGTFELGFFRPGASLNMYLGIWYKNFADKIIVWVANRESPLNTASLKLELSRDGKLVLLTNFTETVWSTALKSPILNSTEAILLDNGNFVIRDVSNTSITYWQSFDYPTDTWLPGGKLGINKQTGQVQRLISWKNSEDPAPGMFSVGIDPNGSIQYFIEWNRSRRYWSSGVWSGQGFTSIPEMRVNIYNFSVISNENESYFTYSMSNTSILSRFVMDTSGKMMQWLWLVGSSQWSLYWSQPTDQADVYAFCGAFGVFNESTTSPCNCIKGFKPFRQNDWSSGCVRESPLQCQKKEGNGRKDEFLRMSNLTLPTNSKTHESANATRCELDCLESCSCTAFAYNNSGCFVWEGDLVNLHQLVEAGVSRAGADIYIKLAAAEFQVENGAGRGNKRRIRAILAVVIPVTFITFGLLIYCCYLRKRKLPHKGEEDTSENLLLFDFDNDPNSTNNVSNSVDNRRKNVELPLFSYESVSAVTEQFSDKLGEGGFGPVYKGKLSNGVEVAVKRLSKGSGQGLEEFRNETILIAKLQHRNLVRLLGCCIERDEKILVYEYMPNKSLDFFLFDANKRQILDWGSRIRIIEGIAQGLLYLHRYSNLRIIHRDLKPSNILLDSEMNPKISDFGMARIFGGSETEANTKKIVGTHGYMSPEYAMDGLFSIKSDVFSFGVLLLEIVSGRKSTGFYHRDCLNLLGQAWKSWNSRRALDMMDPVLGNPPSTSVLLRHINIGLLCVQESPADRPTMSDVFSMIVNENAPLPAPKQPAFATGRNMGDTSSSMSSAGLHSRELGRASKHLTDLEQECFELKKERRKRDEQINSLYADTEEKYVDIHSQKKTNFGRECGVPSKDAHGISQHSENAKPLEGQIDIAYTSKAIGVQTERSIDFTKVELNNDLPSHLGLSETLLGIWGSTSEQQFGRNLISKLFMACPTDFQVLFGCMSMNVSSKVQMDYLQDERSSHAALQYHMCSFPTSEAAKVSHLYSVLTKINNGVLQLEALYRSLLDFCDVTHVAILSSSLHILLVYLKQLLSLGAKSGGDNIKIEGLRSEDSLEGQDLFRMISYETSNAGCSSLGIKSIYPKHLCKKRCLNADISLPLSSVNWVLLFEMMLQIAVSNTEECVILEAISIMNVILMSSNAQTETEKFGQSPVFESVAQLLRREAGLRVQKEALHLLFLLLNCSKLLSIFCSGCKEEEIAGSTNNKKNTSTPKGFSSIFVGLAECIACSGNSIQDIELRKRAIIMLAFLASSGKSSFEIMVSHKLHGETNFLMLILQVLVSEMNVKALAEPARSIKARTSLIREALILLNRLVSSSGYSAIVLRILTARRDMASLTIDVASRLSQEDQSLRPSDVNGHVKESEIVELGQVFKRRVFAYLGDKIS